MLGRALWLTTRKGACAIGFWYPVGATGALAVLSLSPFPVFTHFPFTAAALLQNSWSYSMLVCDYSPPCRFRSMHVCVALTDLLIGTSRCLWCNAAEQFVICSTFSWCNS